MASPEDSTEFEFERTKKIDNNDLQGRINELEKFCSFEKEKLKNISKFLEETKIRLQNVADAVNLSDKGDIRVETELKEIKQDVEILFTSSKTKIDTKELTTKLGHLKEIFELRLKKIDGDIIEFKKNINDKVKTWLGIIGVLATLAGVIIGVLN